LRLISEPRPALHFETFLESGFAMARDLKTDKRRAPRPLLRIFMLLDKVKDAVYPTGFRGRCGEPS